MRTDRGNGQCSQGSARQRQIIHRVPQLSHYQRSVNVNASETEPASALGEALAGFCM